MKTITFGEDETTINIGQLEACPDFCGIEITKGSYLGEKYLLSYNGIEFSFCGGRVDQDSRWANNVDWKTLFNIMNKDGRAKILIFDTPQEMCEWYLGRQ